MVVVDRMAHWVLGYLAAGRPLQPICPRSVQGKWELEGDNRRFRPRGAAGAQPRTDNGGVHPRGGGVFPAGVQTAAETMSPSASHLITRNPVVSCGACAPAAPPGREPLRRRGSLPAPLSPVAPLVVGLFEPGSPARHSSAPSLLCLFEIRPRSPRPHRQLIVVRASRLHGAGLEGERAALWTAMQAGGLHHKRDSLPVPLSPVAPLRGESASPFSTRHRGRRA